MMLDNLQSMLGGRVFYHLASLSEFLIIFGGYDNFSYTYYNDLLSLNTISGVLKRYQPPVEMSHILNFSKICIVGNKVYMCCQEESDEYVQKNHLIHSFDVVNARWETFYPNKEHNARNESPLLFVNLFFYHNESLYILGTDRKIYISEHEENLEEKNRNVIYKLCLKTFKWSLVKHKYFAVQYTVLCLKKSILSNKIGYIFLIHLSLQQKNLEK
ncbi:hypothetical protein RF11_01908 [Thelohanellus kitauei]|uniref:Kelch domain-containing protein 10 n=1 Tax=Thelohanellus kitauei TaxID=669202 RepID=A0A0C2MYF7_THEKT|nr:hypothetical protein RF11_01908 [Thelohanellus kitauei]